MGCLGAAAIQCYGVAGRIAHVTTFAWKFGVENVTPVDVGVSTTVLFFVGSVVFIALGLAATDRLQRAASPMRFCSLFAVLVLISGAIVYGGMLVSPVLVLAPR